MGATTDTAGITGVTTVNGLVSNWQDLSDSALHLSQVNAARRPAFIDSALNNYPVISFDAVNDQFLTNILLNRKNFSISSVYNVREKSARGIRMLNGSTNWIYGPFSGFYRVFNGGFINGKPTVIDRYVAHTAWSVNDVVSNFVNGVNFGQRLNNFRPQLLTIGANAINGNIGELIIVKGLINQQQRFNIDHYLMDKYAPPVNLGEDRIVCSFPDSVELNIDFALNYQWSTGDTTSKLVVDSAGKYFVTITDIFDRQSFDSIYFIEDTSNFRVNLIPDTTLCLGEELSLFAGSELYSYQWNTGATSNAILVDSSAIYRVNVLNCQGQPSIDSVRVTFNQPRFSLGADTSICFHDSIILKTDTIFNVNYSWSTSEVDSIILVNQAGLYALTVTDAYGCNYSDSIFLNVDSSLVLISLGPDTALCSGNEIGLINPPSGIDSYLWSTSETDSVIVVNTPQVYAVTVSKDACQNTDSITISLKGQAPIVGFTADNFCFQDSVIFSDTTSDPNNVSLSQWYWDFGDGDTSNLQNPKHIYDSAGIYMVRLQVQNDSTCSGVFSKNISVFPKPQVNYFNGISCEGDTTFFQNSSSITSGSIVGYSWNFGDTSSAFNSSSTPNAIHVYSEFGTFDVKLSAISNQGCSDSIFKAIHVNAKPQAAFTFQGIYVDDSTTFFNQSGLSNGSIASFLWDFGNNENSSLENPTIFYNQLGSYEVSLTVVSDSSCVSVVSDSVEIINRPPPEPEFNTIIPKNEQTVSEMIDFAWNEKDDADFYQIQISNTEDFTSLLFFRNVNIESFSWKSNLLNETYFWRVVAFNSGQAVDTSNTARFNSFFVNQLDSLTFWVKADTGITLINGLVSEWKDLSDSSKHLIQANPALRPTLIDSALNNKAFVNFDAVNDQFLTGISLNRENFTIASVYNVKEKSARGIRMINGSTGWIYGPFSGIYRVFNGGFTSGKSTIINQYVTHTAWSEKDTVNNFVNGIYYGQRVNSFRPQMLTIGQNAINGNIGEIIIVNGGILQNERQKIDKYLMDKYAPPVNLGADRRVCSFPDSLELNIDYALNYEWSTGDTLTKLVVDSAGKYYVTITDMFERQSVDSVFFILDTNNYQVDFGFEDSTICFGESIDLIAGRAIYNFQWNTGDSSHNLKIDSAGMYKVTVRNCLNQVSTDSIFLSINQPKFSLGADTTACFNQLISLQPDSNFMNVSYQWSNGLTSRTIIADTSRIYGLTVTDNYNCSFSDTVQIGIDSNIYQVNLGPDTSLCEGNQLGLINPPSNISSYTWSTGSNAPFISIDTAGLYTLEYSDGACTVTDSIQIGIKGLAPTADFLASNFCFQDTVQFTNISSIPSGDLITSINWDFGDGDSSTITNPHHVYPAAGNYSVVLEITTDKTCVDTISKGIVIEPKPQADFDRYSSVNCTKEALRFVDLSSVSSGTIAGYFWNFGDTLSNDNTSNIQEPSHTFDTLGNYLITLVVESNQGCKDTISKTLQVNPTPIIGFTFEGNCLNDSTQFFDQTDLQGAALRDYLWAVNTQISQAKNPAFKFLSSGIKPIIFRVRTLDGCQAVLNDNITINSSPVAAFTQNTACSDKPIFIENQSSGTNSIIAFQYVFNQQDTSFLPNPIFQGRSQGSYPLKLKIQDANSCFDSIVKTVIVHPSPKALFSVANSQAGIPFKLNLSNTSSGANNFQWNFGNGIISQDFEPNHTYSDTGTYEVKLKAFSAVGCVDSLSREVVAMPFLLNAVIDRLDLFEDAFGALQLRTRVINSGNNTIENIRLTAAVDNQFQLSENFDTELYRSGAAAFNFSGSFDQNAGDKFDFVCVRIVLLNGNGNPSNYFDEFCEKGFSDRLNLIAFPNPTSDVLTIDFTLPTEGAIQLEFYDALGRKVLNEVNAIYEEGYYRMQFNVLALRPGIYYYRFTYNDSQKVGAFIKK